MSGLSAHFTGVVVGVTILVACDDSTGPQEHLPDRVIDLSVVSVTMTSVNLSFTQVQDGLGEPADYVLGYGSSTLDWEQALANAILIPGTEPGQLLEHEVTGLNPGTDYEFAVAGFRGSLDEDSLFGPVSNLAQAQTFSPPPPAGDEPAFGSDAADELIFQDHFEYADTDALAGSPWNAPSGNFGNIVVIDPEVSFTGGRSVRMDLPEGGGDPGGVLRRTFSGLPTHFFASFYVRWSPGDDVNAGKGVIIQHDKVGDAGCLGRSMARYQIPLMSGNNLHGPNGLSRMFPRYEYNSGCDGPTDLNPTEAIYFTWETEEMELTVENDPRIPVLQSDPDIGQVPWSPVNDGNWHRWTMEIKVGDGPNGYRRLWLDGHLVWDSSGGPMNHPGRPTMFEWNFTTGSSRTASTVWFDDVVLWSRP